LFTSILLIPIATHITKPHSSSQLPLINMSYDGKCHCGQTTWTVKLDKEQSKHILW